MKKDIEWLKEKVEEMYTHYSISNNFDFVSKREAITEISNLINQLDEQESLSQEWIDENKVARIDNLRKMTTSDVVPVEKLKNLLAPKEEITFEQAHDKLREESILSQKSFDYYWNCINDNVEIDEPGNILVPKQEKPVIPQFVADWIEASRYAMYHLLGAVYDGTYSEDMKEWLFRGDKRTRQDNQDKLTRSWLDGYEVEKEKKYYVMNEENELILGWSQSAYMTPCIEGYEYMKHAGRENLFQLTEQEIKEYDERYWAFAQEVTE